MSFPGGIDAQSSSWSQVGSDSDPNSSATEVASLAARTWAAIASADEEAILEINDVVSGLPREALINEAFQDTAVRTFAEGAFTARTPRAEAGSE